MVRQINRRGVQHKMTNITFVVRRRQSSVLHHWCEDCARRTDLLWFKILIESCDQNLRRGRSIALGWREGSNLVHGDRHPCTVPCLPAVLIALVTNAHLHELLRSSACQPRGNDLASSAKLRIPLVPQRKYNKLMLGAFAFKVLDLLVKKLTAGWHLAVAARGHKSYDRSGVHSVQVAALIQLSHLFDNATTLLRRPGKTPGHNFGCASLGRVEDQNLRTLQTLHQLRNSCTGRELFRAVLHGSVPLGQMVFQLRLQPLGILRQGPLQL
mmetsp:Transcript_5518/g.12141  ORF Transcript_5518/g.12141 Transcript_5518/m.12141 type:complete len:269 (-) Transcript_5518:540-1346(-)